jgi:hypothetical protein
LNAQIESYDSEECGCIITQNSQSFKFNGIGEGFWTNIPRKRKKDSRRAAGEPSKESEEIQRDSQTGTTHGLQALQSRGSDHPNRNGSYARPGETQLYQTDQPSRGGVLRPGGGVLNRQSISKGCRYRYCKIC